MVVVNFDFVLSHPGVVLQHEHVRGEISRNDFFKCQPRLIHVVLYKLNKNTTRVQGDKKVPTYNIEKSKHSRMRAIVASCSRLVGRQTGNVSLAEKQAG